MLGAAWEENVAGVDAGVCAVEGVAVEGKEHDRSLTTQLLQVGRASSHLICRLLHSRQPLRDLRWARRSFVGIEPEPEPEPERLRSPAAASRVCGGIAGREAKS